MTSRNARETSAATPQVALPPVPPLCCDLCDWPMAVHDIALAEDGTIPGLIVCTQCIEDNLQSEIAA